MPPDAATASAHYRLASVGFGNTPAVASFMFAPIQAKLALGYLHEFGAGVPQDLNLAKRHYESALETAGPAWLPPHIAVSALRVHRAWRRTATAYPILTWLQQPLDTAARWALHRCRCLIDPVYAFHVPTQPPSNFMAGEAGLDSFADAPPPSQPLGVTAAEEPAAAAKAPQPAARRAVWRGAVPGAATAAWERVRAEVAGAIGYVQRFVRTMLMLDGGFAPSTAVIVGLLVLRIVLQFAMEALMAQGRGAAAAGDGAGGDDAGADGGDLDEGDGVADANQEPNLDIADQIALASPASAASESDFSPSPVPAAAEPLPDGPGGVARAPASTAARAVDEGGFDAGGAAVAPKYFGLRAGAPGEAAPSSVRYEDAIELAVEGARRRSVAAAMSRMHAQDREPEGSSRGGATDAVTTGTGDAATSSPAVSAADAPAGDGSKRGVQGAAASEQAGVGCGDDEPLMGRLRGAGWLHDMEEDMGDDDDTASADQGGVGGPAPVAPVAPVATGLSGSQDQDFGWAGFGTVASDTDGPPAGFWAASGAVGNRPAAAPTGDSRAGGATAFSQLSCALSGSAGGTGGFAEPSPLSHSIDVPEGQPHGAPAAGPPPPLAFPALDLCPAAAQAPGPSGILAGPPQLALDLPPLQTGKADTGAGAGGFECGFGSPVSDATVPGGAFSGFPLLGVLAGPHDDAGGNHGDASLDADLPQQVQKHAGYATDYPAPQDDDDLPDLDPSGHQTLPSITLTGHTLPVSTGAAFGVPASGTPLLLAPHGTSGGPATGPTMASPLREGAVEVEELKADASHAPAAVAAGDADAAAGRSS